MHGQQNIKKKKRRNIVIPVRHLQTKYEITNKQTNKRQFKQEALPVELQAGQLAHHCQCPTVRVAMHES